MKVRQGISGWDGSGCSKEPPARPQEGRELLMGSCSVPSRASSCFPPTTIICLPVLPVSTGCVSRFHRLLIPTVTGSCRKNSGGTQPWECIHLLKQAFDGNVWVVLFNPMLAFICLFSMRRLALVYLKGTVLFSTSAFIGLKGRKNACVGESQNDGKEKSGSAEQLSIASLAFNFLDLICLYIDHISPGIPACHFIGILLVLGMDNVRCHTFNDTQSLLVNKINPIALILC